MRGVSWGWLVGLVLVGASAPASAGTVAFVGGTVHLPEGPRQGMTVVVEGGRIVQVLEGGAPAGAEVVSVEGKHLSAGLVAAPSQLGLVEVSLEDPTDDAGSTRTDDIRATFRAQDAYNPRSTLLPVARLEGVTSAVCAPVGGLLSGQAAWVDLDGETQAEAIVETPIAFFASIGGAEGSRADQLLRLRQVLADARTFQTQRAAWERNQTRPWVASPQDLMALAPLIEGKVPLAVQVDRAADIEAVLRLATEQKIRLVIIGGSEAWLLAPALAEARVPVLIDPFVYGPTSFDDRDARPDNVVVLHDAGVKVLIGSTDGMNPHRARIVRQLAGNAVRAGLPAEEALRAVTQSPAEVFGIEGYGRIAAGAVANLVVWTGDPLELTTWAESVWIHGERMEMESRQTELLERYRAMPGGPPAPLPLPTAGP